MIFCDDEALILPLRQALCLADRLVLPIKLRVKLIRLVNNRQRPHAVVTAGWYPITKPAIERYMGCTRRYGDLSVIDIKDTSVLPLSVLLLHELVHVVGGSELDSEVVEKMACDILGCEPHITTSELLEFINEPTGVFFYIYISGHYLWTNEYKLWRMPPGDELHG